MIHGDKSKLILQASSVSWAIDLLEPLVMSLRQRAKIGPEAEVALSGLRDVKKTLDFMARPDVVIDLTRRQG